MAQIEDLTRDKIIARFRERIHLGRRTKLHKAELEALTIDFIDQLAHTQSPDEVQQLCQSEIELLEEGYPQLTLASIYIPRYRRAIEAAIADQTLPSEQVHTFEHKQHITGITEPRTEHWALSYFKYGRETYEQLDQRQAQINRTKLLNLKGVNPHHYLDFLNDLLNSGDKFQDRHMAVAIAGLTGRRLGEVAARGTFTLTDHPYLLHFDGQQKHERSGYNIVTLIPAGTLLEKIQLFRKLPTIQALFDLEGKALAQAINKFDVQVNRECNKYLHIREAIVPPLENRVNVTVHNLRSLWGAIAVWMFCPPQQHEYAFIQHYLGHVIDSAATGHYFRYQLIDANGQPLRDKGTYLDQVPALPLLDPEFEDAPRNTLDVDTQPADAASVPPPSVPPAPLSPRTSSQNADDVSPPATFKNLRTELLNQLKAVEAKLRAEWASQLAALKQDLTPHPQTSDSNKWLIARVSALEAENQTLRQERDALLVVQTELTQTQADLKQTQRSLTDQLNDAQAKLDRFKRLLLGENTDVDAPVTSSSSSKPQTIALARPAPSSTPATPKRGRKRGRAEQRAKLIFAALKAWNTEHPPDETLVLNPGLLETGFHIHRQAAKKFCCDFAAAIEAHHQQIQASNPVSHNRGKDISGFIAFAEAFDSQ